MNKWLKVIINLVIFIVSLTLIIIGQQTVGAANLGVMMIGLVGILVLLFMYNKKYQ